MISLGSKLTDRLASAARNSGSAASSAALAIVVTLDNLCSALAQPEGRGVARRGEEGAEGEKKSAKAAKTPSKDIRIEQIRALADNAKEFGIDVVTLPSSGIVVLISTRYHEYAPGDDRLQIEPDIPVEVTTALAPPSRSASASASRSASRT